MDRDVLDGNQGIATERVAVAKELANKHYEMEAGLTQILSINTRPETESSSTEPIKLLEVNNQPRPEDVVLGKPPEEAVSVW